MKRGRKTLEVASELRKGAEARLRTGWAAPSMGKRGKASEADTHKLLHELQVHQAELEMQNEELRKARDEVEAGQEKFRDLYEFAPIGYFTLTEQGVIDQVNLTGAILARVERARLVGRPFTALLSAAMRPVFHSFLQLVFSRQARQEQDVEFVSVGESPRIVNLKAQRSASGKDCRLVVVDITEKRRAEAATAELAAIVTTSNDAIITMGLNGNITSWNASAENVFGYSAKEMLGQPIARLIPPDRLHEAALIMSRLRKGENVDHFETLRIAKDGRLLEVSVAVSPIRLASGKIVGVSKVARDITERIRAEAALRESEERLRLSQDVAQVGTFDCNLITGVNFWTPKLEAMHGLSAGSFAKTTEAWEKLVHPEDRAAAVACVEKTLRSGKSVEAEWRVIWPDGSIRWMAGRFRAFKDIDGKPVRVAGVNVDVTERKTAETAQRRVVVLAALNRRLENEISQRRAVEKSLKLSERHQRRLLKQSHHLHEQLRQLTRKVLEAQEDERKRISRELHDVIAQTLNGINVRLAILRKEAALKIEGLDRNIANTQKLVEESVELVHEFARELRPAVLDDLGLIPALHSFVRLFSKRTGILVHIQASPEVEELDMARRTVLYRVAQEALSNVARHARASRVEVNLQKLTDRIDMSVRDNGKSFDAGRFLNAKARGRLGLLGMRERLEMVGGRFEITSEKGKGTTVIAQIPLGKPRGRRGTVSEILQADANASPD